MPSVVCRQVAAQADVAEKPERAGTLHLPKGLNSKVPGIVRKASQAVFGAPVLSFPYELSRITMNLMQKRPGILAGMMLAGLGRNFMALAGSGVNPYAVMAELRREGGSDMALPLQFMGRQVVPTGDGNFVMAQMPGLSMYENMFDLFGATRGIVDIWEDPSIGAAGKVLQAGATVGSKIFLGSPVAQVGASLATRRDPRTGDINRDTPSLLSANAVHTMQSMIPNWMPYVGKNATIIREVQAGIPQAYSKRRISVAQTVLQRMFGLKFRGDITQLLPDSVEAGVERFVRGFAMLETFEVPTKDPRTILGEGRGLDVWDLFSTLRQATAPLDKKGGRDMQVEVDPAFADIRRAGVWATSGDPAREAAAKDLIASAREKFMESRRVDDIWNRTGVGREATERDFVALLQATRRFTDESQQLANMTLLRRTGIMTMMSEYGAARLPGGEDFMNSLMKQYLFSNPGSLRAPGVPDEIEASIEMIDLSLARKGPWTDQASLLKAKTFLKAWLPGAKVQEISRKIRQKNVRDAFKLIERIEQ